MPLQSPHESALGHRQARRALLRGLPRPRHPLDPRHAESARARSRLRLAFSGGDARPLLPRGDRHAPRHRNRARPSARNRMPRRGAVPRSRCPRARDARGRGLPRHALACERHTGAGITREEVAAQDLPLPRDRDYLPITLEEKPSASPTSSTAKSPAACGTRRRFETSTARWRSTVRASPNAGSGCGRSSALVECRLDGRREERCLWKGALRESRLVAASSDTAAAFPRRQRDGFLPHVDRGFKCK